MRSIARIDNHDEALLAGAHLVSNGVECKVTEEHSGDSCLWVMHEDQLPRGRELLEQFMTDPNKERYREAVEYARRLAREQEEQPHSAPRIRIPDMTRPAYWTWALVAVCTGLWLLMAVRPQMTEGIYQALLIGTPGEPFLHALQAGEFWRLFTPSLLHASLWDDNGNLQTMGILHIFFNMTLLRDLGGVIERRESGRKFFGLFVVLSALPNLVQYHFAGPNFVGMSGVVFGLFGYLWMRGKFDPLYGLRLNPGLITSALIWFALCMLLPGIANYVHAAGLALGMTIGYAQAMAVRRRVGS